MKLTLKYRQHAAECRALAVGTQTPEQRDMLMRMAETWESLTSECEEPVRLRPEITVPVKDQNTG